MVDILIRHGILLTMDPNRRIIHDGAIAIEKDQILEVPGHDVDMILVDGQIRMDNRQVLSTDETKVLEQAQEEAEDAIARGNLEKYMQIPDNFWSKSRY